MKKRIGAYGSTRSKIVLVFYLYRYIYTDKININSMDKACELCYVAKKYMLPTVVQRCTDYLWSDLNSKNVCRAFEFAKLFEEPDLAERCLQVRLIKNQLAKFQNAYTIIVFVNRLYAVKRMTY